MDALRKNDAVELIKVLGPDGMDIISSGDKVEDAAVKDRFLKDYDQKHVVVAKGPDARGAVMAAAEKSGAGGIMHILFHAAPHNEHFISLMREHLSTPMVEEASVSTAPTDRS